MSDKPFPTRCFGVRDRRTGRLVASYRSGYWSRPKAYQLMRVPPVELAREYAVVPVAGTDYIPNGPGSIAHAAGLGLTAPNPKPPAVAPLDVVIAAISTNLHSYERSALGRRDVRARELHELLAWKPPEL
jgi:hypothetical protein